MKYYHCDSVSCIFTNDLNQLASNCVAVVVNFKDSNGTSLPKITSLYAKHIFSLILFQDLPKIASLSQHQTYFFL
jgi:hypothetical protein